MALNVREHPWFGEDQMKASLDKCTLPEHFVYVAWKHDEPGARAACIDEEGYEEHLIEWMAEMVREGCKITRVTCDQGHELLRAYRRWCDAGAVKIVK